MDNLVINSNDNFGNHMDILYDVLNRLEKSVMKVNTVECDQGHYYVVV